MAYSLRQLKDITKDAYNKLTWEVKKIPSNPSISDFGNADELRNTVEILQQTGLFEDHITILKNSTLFSVPGNNLRMQTVEASLLDSTLTLLDDVLKNFYLALELNLPAEDPSSINIKLPPVNDFSDLSQYSKDFHLALSQVLYLEEINSSIKIESVENGSIWLNVFVYGSIAIGLVGSLVWSAAVIYKKILEGKIMDEQLRGLKIRTDSMDDVRNAQKESLTQLIQAEAEFINSNAFKKNVPDNIERIKGSIKLLADLLDKGAEVHPAIGAPEEIANLYPNMKSLPTIESKTKLLSA